VKKGLAIGCWVVATALGIGAGHYVLPDRSTVHWPWATGSPSGGRTSTADGTSAPPEQLPTTFAKTPPTKHDFASVKNFRQAGFSVRVYALDSGTSPTTSATLCSDEQKVGARTLGDLTGYDPSIAGSWADNRSDSTADQMIAVADSPAEARTAANELLNSNSPCRHEPVGHWVFGKPEQKLIAPGVWAAWIPQYDGKDNTTGSAPTGKTPVGAELILRNGERFSVLDAYLIGSTEQFGELAVGAANRLG
jgi:hypothetical protein